MVVMTPGTRLEIIEDSEHISRFERPKKAPDKILRIEKALNKSIRDLSKREVKILFLPCFKINDWRYCPAIDCDGALPRATGNSDAIRFS